MKWLDPDHLPQVMSSVERFLLNPHGDADIRVRMRCDPAARHRPCVWRTSAPKKHKKDKPHHPDSEHGPGVDAA